jgi:hypothetical protein
MTDAGRTIVNYTSTQAPALDGLYNFAADTAAGAYLPMNNSGAASLKTDVVCIQVNFPDGGAPASLILGDNAWNGATSSTYSTIVTFTFDAAQRVLAANFNQ